MALKTIEDVDVQGLRVLMRVDFNVPLDGDGCVVDDFRIRAALPSIRSVLARGGRLVLISHLGRPGGGGYEAASSLAALAPVLSDLLSDVLPGGVGFPSRDCVDDAALAATEAMSDGEVVLLENLRFHGGETAGEEPFARQLARLGDVYCNNAFGTCHRPHASMYALPMAMKPEPCVAGCLVAEEVRFMADALEEPERPFVAITGGAKVSDKISALKNLIGKVDTLLVGGAMAYTLMKVLGHEVGSSLVENDRLDEAKEIIRLVDGSATDLVLPVDHVCGHELSHESPVMVAEESIPEGWMGLDIGPATTARFTRIVREAKTVVWNGPLGAFETRPFDVGTRQVAVALAACTASGGLTIVGGGDTAAAVELAGVSGRVSHVSTGGGASLRLLEGASLIGLEPLEERQAFH
jgi:phosphoglycerate kinase